MVERKERREKKKRIGSLVLFVFPRLCKSKLRCHCQLFLSSTLTVRSPLCVCVCVYVSLGVTSRLIGIKRELEFVNKVC